MAKRELGSKEHLHGTMAKRKRSGLQLSSLPTDILRRIVSKLPIKEAVQTSILSEQWKFHWCFHSNLVFRLRSMLPRHCYSGLITIEGEKLKKQKFIERVDAVLQQHSGLGVENMEVWARFHHEYTDQIERWVNFAIASKTKHLIFNFSPAISIERCIFDLRLLNNSDSLHLQSIKLSSVFLKLPADFKGFQNLKRLHLADTNITDGDLQLLISICNVLEFLGISDCMMLTRLWTSHPSNPLKHLQVYNCHLLQAMELNFGLVTLEYSGQLIPLSPPGTLLLTNICMKLSSRCSSVEYIITKLPSIVPRLEMLTLKCHEWERATLPGKLPVFVYLRHLRLELIFEGLWQKKTDALDFACLLVAAPFLEILEFHMWMASEHLRYSIYHGKLRSLPSQPHSHLRLVDISGFYGQKDQLELALHILTNSVMLEAMKIDPKPAIAADCARLASDEGLRFLEFLCRRDHRNVVHITRLPSQDLATTPAYYFIDPFWIKFLSEKQAKSVQAWLRSAWFAALRLRIR